MDHSTVKAIDLWAAANLMRSDKMKFVEVQISDDGSLSFTATTSKDDIESVTYDPIDPIEGNPTIF